MTNCVWRRNFPIWAALGLLGICFGCRALFGQDSTRRTIVCDEAHGCSHQFMNGSKFKIITDNGIVIAAGPDTGLLPSKFMSMSVIVYNHTANSIDVIPSLMLLEVVEPKEKTLRPITPDRVARTVNHGDLYTSLMKLALNSNTVDPGESVSGSLYFEGDKKAKIIYLLISIAGTVYEFPFSMDGTN
jgi:hypothetical protein